MKRAAYRALSFVLSCIVLVACGGATPAPRMATDSDGSSTPGADGPPGAPVDPFAIQIAYRSEPTLPPVTALDRAKWAGAIKARGGPPPPKACAAYAGRAPACATDRKDALSELASALGTALPLGPGAEPSESKRRDSALRKLERCDAFEPGWVAALRASLAPIECADAIADPALAAAKTAPEIEHALAGLALRGRLARALAEPPTFAGPATKERVLGYIQGAFKDWMTAHAGNIERWSQIAAELKGYGRGVAALEAGTTDLRFVEVAREAPIPDEIAKDEELKGVYTDALEQALEPRKRRARDALSVGLADLAAVGDYADPHVAEVRATTDAVYGGLRLGPLTELLRPSLFDPPTETAEAKLAARLPTYFAGRLFGDRLSTDAMLARAAFARGLPAAWRTAQSERTGLVDASTLVAARIELGLAFVRGADFDAAVRLCRLEGPVGKSANTDLAHALALALRTAPDGIARWVLAIAPSDRRFDLRALDVLARGQGASAARAVFDRAWLDKLSPPDGADRAFFLDLEQRFARAAKALDAGTERERASQAAREAHEIAMRLGSP